MNKLLAIARYTFIESVRNKVFYVLVLFGVIITGASILLSALGGEQGQRILLDLGLGAIEIFALVTVVFAAVTLVLEEIEAKTIYLVMTRPVSRVTYIAGRYLGLLLAVYCGMLIMAAVHVVILLLAQWHFTARYAVALLMSGGKIMIIGSIALFFSLASTSAVSSISFTLFFWLLGHFSEEIRYLAGKLPGALPKVMGQAVYYIIPNLQYFNVRDFWDVPGVFGNWMLLALPYALVYSAAFIGLSLVFFKVKEF